MTPVLLRTHLRTNAELPQSITSAFKAAVMPPTDQTSMVQEPCKQIKFATSLNLCNDCATRFSTHYGNEARLNAVLSMLKLSHCFRDFSLVQHMLKLSHWDHFR